MIWRCLPNFVLGRAFSLNHILILCIAEMIAGNRVNFFLDDDIFLVDPQLLSCHSVRRPLSLIVKLVDTILQPAHSRFDVGISHVALPRSLSPRASWPCDWTATTIFTQILVVIWIGLSLSLCRLIVYRKLFWNQESQSIPKSVQAIQHHILPQRIFEHKSLSWMLRHLHSPPSTEWLPRSQNTCRDNCIWLDPRRVRTDSSSVSLQPFISKLNLWITEKIAGHSLK